MPVKVGTAGWTVARDAAAHFPVEGSGLERYASGFAVAEINSSFHRPHRLSTWERWRDSVPADFRFSAKLPKTITHQRKLVDCAEPLGEFMAQVEVLGDRLGVLLVQLPPKLAFDADLAGGFFAELKGRTDVQVACEPRHPSWFEQDADALLAGLQVARVAADPALSDAAALPGGWRGFSYWRLHGSPVIYRSSYMDRIGQFAERIDAHSAEGGNWCIFDNTASSAATADALALAAALGAD